MAESIDFYGWFRPAVGDLVTGIEAGRSCAAVDVTLTGRDAGGAQTGTEAATLAFLLAGPGDVVGLQPGAIRRRFPTPGVIDAETTKCAYVEFTDPGLPWRYTPGPNPAPAMRSLRPWLVLLVGTEAELELSGGRVALSESVREQHALAPSARWAHVQTGGGRQIARVLSPRLLEATTDYLAVVVPAFSGGPAFGDAWGATGPATVPAYDVWRFRTGPGGDFRSLARRLRPARVTSEIGRAPVRYPRVPAIAPMSMRGALAPVGSSDTGVPAEIATDLVALRVPPPDPRRRPVLAMPHYGRAWLADPESTSWGATVNRDPRFRGAAGLGLDAGVELQEELVEEVLQQAGALAEAGQRIRELTLGLAAGAALWTRRLPSDPVRRLWVLGPALRRLVTDEGTIDELATAADRPLPEGVFSSAARRVTRNGPARTGHAAPRAFDPRAVLGGANRCAPGDRARTIGIPLDALEADDFAERVRRQLEEG
jgi:hypothetical protein